METDTPKTTPILHIAWERYAQLNTLSKHRSRAFRQLRIGLAVLGILATLFAILTQVFAPQQQPWVQAVVKVFFISIPIIASLLATLGARAFSNGDWLIARAAAEEYLKEIYLYRTIHQKKKSRREHLVERLDAIQRQLYRGLGGEFALEAYTGPVPPYAKPDDPKSDSGYHDLNGGEYFRFRLDPQRRWHEGKVLLFKRERAILTYLVLAAGGLGTFFAAWGQPLSIWVALTASIAAALIGWQELRNIDSIIKNYSRVILELTSIHDRWLNLEPRERTTREFYKMVRATEGVLWAQHLEYIRSQQEALKEAEREGEAEESEAEEPLTETLKDNIREAAEKALEEEKREVLEPIKEAASSLAAEASAEAIQPALQEMGKAVAEAAGRIQERTSSMTESIQEVTQDVANAEITGITSKEDPDATPARISETQDPAG
jgi:conflict system pore-forming effector with SLATT domain